MTGRLEGLVVIISGAARGQGAAEATLFATEGAQLVLGDVLRDEVANLAAFLASSESSYMTGGELTIDGGSTAGPAPRYDWKPE
ncbi:MAG TPA: hypothetical protein DGK99_04320 [Acidimicrobiaceae bacterium]|jgi:NAD(P)-dependent dehydrogenase (short-subunit alcohol dehydrogenase family)|nr:SDR family oxidoreductase [Actinomycetes bacterium]MDP6160444.1 SDR family oxidoreductase [Acidimicrobiales bacterium]MDP6288448.1 SDR family oxidoreductase [Acidimicrobiales bacterium]HCW00616.1 hypothetical protein [Acidimicrobiaceae bacterium]HJP24880.1 SDR family oxidoreductase [Acidimicrobiales bacterium]|tara:strand:- start:319 stop:570 length:252 start_codon:yes stop_codon:yes gene_type:complete